MKPGRLFFTLEYCRHTHVCMHSLRKWITCFW